MAFASGYFNFAKMKGKKILLVSNVGFATYWLPINILQLQQYLANNGADVDCLYLSVLFTDYVRKEYPHYSKLNECDSEWGYSFQEQYFADKIFGLNNIDRVFKRMLINQYLNRDIYYSKMNEADNSFVRENSDQVQKELKYILKYCQIVENYMETILRNIDFQQYCLIGFSCNQAQFFSSLYCSYVIKRKYNNEIKIVFGGPMFEIWNMKQYVINFPIIDFIITSPGEEKLLKLLRGLLIIKDKKIKKQPYKEISHLLKKSHDFEGTIMASRGCSWGKCRICNIDNTNFYKYRNPKIILHEIQYLYKKYGIRSFNFCDMELNGNLANLECLCQLIIKSGLNLKFWGEVNSKNTSKRSFQLMTNAGITNLQCGIESFSSSLLEKMKKRSSLVDNIKTIKWAYESRLDWFSFNLICGYPLEDSREVAETLNMLEKINHLLKNHIAVDIIDFNFFRNSPLYRESGNLDVKVKKSQSYEFDKSCVPRSFRAKFRFPLVKYINKKFVKKWQKINDLIEKAYRRKYEFHYRIFNTHISVYDTRNGKKKDTILYNERAEIFRLLNEKPITTKELKGKISYLSENDLQAILEDFASRNWLIKDRSYYFGLATVVP